MQSLFMTITNANFDGEKIQSQIDKVKALQSCGCGCCAAKPELPAGVLATENEDLRSLRELLIYGLKGIAAYADHAAVLGKENPDIYAFAFKALAATTKDLSVDELVGLVLECGKVAVDTMALLDGANTGTFGNPEITSVKLGVGNRPGILISGHDLLDLKELLEQSADQGIDIYTHGEMLPAHYYPELKKYGHLYGNYGNAWHKQNTEFASFNGPILMTTNCITPVQPAYANRIFTTGMAGYPGVKHIADRVTDRPRFLRNHRPGTNLPAPTELESGELVGGLPIIRCWHYDKVIAAVKSGAIKRFVVMAGCDGRHKTREYFTEVAETLPKDTIILTAGCAKHRYKS